jgi:uncharacterized membrane protein YdjX (TVP38/TMEM64 family)
MNNVNPDAAKHRRRRLGLVAAGGVALVAAGIAAWFVPAERWSEAWALVGSAMEWVRALGAGWFFAAFAVLPAVGFPVSVFALSAGSLFGPTLGLPMVLALAGLSMAVSMSISYGLARYAVRPWVTRLLGYVGYRVPVVPAEKQKVFTVLVRITPGPPYVFQSFLLGLAGVPFWTYLAISWAICTVNICLVIVFGDALAQGKGKVALLALAGVVLVVLAVKLVRKRMVKRAASIRQMAVATEGEGGDGV